MDLSRALATTAIAALVAVSHAQQAQIKLAAFPAMSVADGRSTTTISATVRDQRGNPVADGTRVIFESTMGLFRENIVTTSNGVARAVLQAGGVPGVATITVKTLDSMSQPGTLEFEFKGDRSELSSALEYFELVSDGYMEFAPEFRVIAAAAPNKGVFVRYRDVTITADDVQINIPKYELRARKARLKVGKLEQEFEELYLKLNERTGIGTTTYKARRPIPVTLERGLPTFLSSDPAAYEQAGEEFERFGLVDIKRDVLTPAADVQQVYKLTFEVASGATSSIAAKKAVIFPQREIQFHRAQIMVGGNRVMTMPLYQLNLVQTVGGSVMGSMVNVQNNQLQVNYPYYLSLKPGQTSLLRFRTGDSYGRGVSASSGMFLDYELNWNRGDEMDGKFFLNGIGRKDMTLGVQQYMRFDDRSSAFGTIEMPANDGVYGSLNVNRLYDGFQMNANASMTQTLRGIKYSTRNISFVAEKDPTKLGSLPARLYLGLTAQESANSLIGSSQSGIGLRARLQSLPIRISNRSTFYAGLSMAQLAGRNVSAGGLTLAGEASLSHQFSNQLNLRATYSYLKDGYNDRFLGTQRVGLEGRYYSDRFSLSMLAGKSLDLDRFNLYGDLSLNVTGNWWISSFYTLDQYLSYNFLDYSLGVGYRIGGREIGLVWSKSTNRIGIQLLGAAF